MTQPDASHDPFFREIISDPVAAAGVLENVLPADVRALVDLDSIEIEKDSFVEPDLRAYYSDALFRVRMAGEPGNVYLLIEHKSHPDRFVHVQALSYIKPIWGRRRGPDLPAVIPVVVYHGQRPWPYDPKFSKVFPPKSPQLRRFFPDFEVVLADLSQYPDEEIRGAVLTRAFLLMLKHVRSPDFPERLPGIFRLFGELSRSRTGLGHLEAMLRYMARAAENITPETVETLVEEYVPGPEGGKLMATLAEQWEERGIRKGIQQGVQQGVRNGLREAIREGLGSKFGEAGLALAPEIDSIKDPDRLRALLKIAWRVSSLEEFCRKLREG